MPCKTPTPTLFDEQLTSAPQKLTRLNCAQQRAYGTILQGHTIRQPILLRLLLFLFTFIEEY